MSDTEAKTGLFANIKTLIQANIKRVKDIKQLATLEARLAGQTLTKIMALAIMIVLLLFATWLCVLFGVFIAILSAHYSPLTAVACMILLNILACFICVTIIKTSKKDLTFAATRKQLQHLKKFDKGDSA